MSNPFFDDARDDPSPFRRSAKEESVYSRPTKKTTKKKATAAKKPAPKRGTNTRDGMGPFKEGFPTTRRAPSPSGPLQQVSRMGVDPRSPQGQQILEMLESGYDLNDPMISQAVGELVGEYQDTLVGPLSKNRRPAPGDAMGPFFDREGNQYGYTTGDVFDELDGLSTENLARVQARMVGLGLLENYVPGKRDGDTQKAFSYLLQMANSSGQDWAREMSQLEQIQAEDPEGWAERMGIGGEDEGPAPFVTPAYEAPDYATLAQGVKDQMRRSLGRDPDESEMAILTAELAGFDREAYEADVAGQRAQYDAEVGASEGREGMGGATVQGVDPVARFKESFEQRFAGRLAAGEDMVTADESQESVEGSTSLLSRMSGGMG